MSEPKVNVDALDILQLYKCLDRIVRQITGGHAASSDAMVAAMKILDKVDRGLRYKEACAKQPSLHSRERKEDQPTKD